MQPITVLNMTTPKTEARVLAALIALMFTVVLLLAATRANAAIPETCQSLECAIRRIGYAGDTWVLVARIESGMGTDGVGRVNNLFGMRCHSRGYQSGCTDNGYGAYAHQHHAIADLCEWIQLSPPMRLDVWVPLFGRVTMCEEPPYYYLYRRCWQPRAWMPGYWLKLQSLTNNAQ